MHHFLVENTKIENSTFPCKCQNLILRQMEWGAQNGPITKNGFASNYFTFLKILFQYKNLLHKELICNTNYSDVHIHTFH